MRKLPGVVAFLGLLSACCRVGAGHLTPAELEDARRDQAERAGAGYESSVVAPFVLVANGRDVQREAEDVVAYARDRMRADFFDDEPGKPITIWVFTDQNAYMSGSSAILGIIPSTPYGFYRPCSRALVVNAGSGWGTLFHEMVHAYIDADFRSAPTWLNEGLASLFEAPVELHSRLRGAINWRLPALQAALRAHDAPSFEELTDAGRFAFDGKRGALLYASARYVLYWLQERELLHAFYRAFRAEGGDGLSVLQSVTHQTVAALRAEWEPYVLSLTFVPRGALRGEALAAPHNQASQVGTTSVRGPNPE